VLQSDLWANHHRPGLLGFEGVLQRVAVCCSVLQCVALRCMFLASKVAGS